MAHLEDVEAMCLLMARNRAQAEGLHFDAWQIHWDGGPVLVTAMAGGKPRREFRVCPTDGRPILFERDPYTEDWEAVNA